MAGRLTMSSTKQSGDTGATTDVSKDASKMGVHGGASFEAAASKGKSKSLLLSRGSKSADHEAAARKKRQTKRRTENMAKMAAQEQVSYSLGTLL